MASKPSLTPTSQGLSLNTPAPPISTKIPLYIYYILAGLLVVVVILVIQVMHVRSSLATYSKDDYYKQLLVKNEYTSTQSTTACSNFGVYALQVDTAIAKHLNSGVIHTYASNKIDTPKFFYSVPTPKNGIMSIEYKSRNINFLPLKAKSASTSRLVNDMLGGRVEFITWQKGMFRVVLAPSFKEDMKEFFETKGFDNVRKALDDVVVVVLVKLPTLSELAEDNYVLSQMLERGNAPDGIIHTFIGQSTLEFNVDALPNGLHVIGYKI